MSHVVIGHKDGKPIYRDEGPNRAIHAAKDPQLIQPILEPHATGWRLGLPNRRAVPWRKVS